MSDFLITECEGRKIVARVEGSEEVFGAIENGDWTELTRRAIPEPAPVEAVKRPVSYSMPNHFWTVTEKPTAEGLRELKERLGLTGAQIAQITGVNPRTVRKWLGKETGIPNAAWHLLNVYADSIQRHWMNQKKTRLIDGIRVEAVVAIATGGMRGPGAWLTSEYRVLSEGPDGSPRITQYEIAPKYFDDEEEAIEYCLREAEKQIRGR